MNYKELLNRYKKGLVSEEEKQLIEEELEKQEAFEEYISQGFDDELFDEELKNITKTSYVEIHDEETIKLKKSVNKRLRKVVISSVLTIIALCFVIFLVSSIVDGVYYDPTATTQSDTTQLGKGLRSDFYYDMQAYISLNIPGYSMSSFTSEKSKGFGKYEISYSMKNLFTKDEQRYFVNFSRGKSPYVMDGIFSREEMYGVWEGFKIGRGGTPEGLNEKNISYLNELNPLSYISMSIVFDDDLTMEEFYNMSSQHESLNYKWVGVRTVYYGTEWSENQPMHFIGFNPNLKDVYPTPEGPNPEEYPFFYLEDIWDSQLYTNKGLTEAMPEAYETHFKSRLEYLKSREEFIKIFDYNEYKIDFYDNALEYIDENGVKTYGVLVYGTVSDFLDHLDEIPYAHFYINEALPMKANIYDD